MADEPRTYTELRDDLRKLADEQNRMRLDLVDLQKLMAANIAKLCEAADHLIPRAHAERDASGELRPEYKPSTGIDAVADHMNPSRRNCGLCGKPGHRRDNCPDADKIQQEKKETHEVKAERKARKAAIKGTGKRACSNCHKPGHRAKNCPEPVLPKRGRK